MGRMSAIPPQRENKSRRRFVGRRKKSPYKGIAAVEGRGENVEGLEVFNRKRHWEEIGGVAGFVKDNREGPEF